MTAMKTLPDLSGFIGGGDQFRHPFGRIRFTEGVKYLADEAGAFWLIDAVASHQPRARQRCEPQFWTLEPNKPDGTNPRGCRLVLRADSGQPPIITQRIEFTDFPFAEKDGKPRGFDVWVCDGVMLLPGEY